MGLAFAGMLMASCADSPTAVADYQGGNQKVAGFLVGQAMRQLKGKADPAGVKACVEKALCQIHESNI